MTSSERLAEIQARSGESVTRVDADLVEVRDRCGRLIDRFRLSNLGGAPLRRKGDTNVAWRSW